ncbi:sulfonate ABC transporter permease [Achromatium sp. WMS2]|nr:sulfonate ABC transporter permease [Achromatium sp. WMS2]
MNPTLASIIAFSTAIITWELATLVGNFEPNILPGPLTVLKSLYELVLDGTLIKHSIASLFRVTAGFYLAMFFGIPLGILIGRNRLAYLLLNPIIQFLRPISPLAWIPLAMLWFGIGDAPAIFLIFLASLFPLIVSTVVAVQSIDPIYFYVAANFNLTPWEITHKIIIPAIIPGVMTALRIAISIAWLVVVAAEMIAVQSGLGYLILDSRNALRMDYVMVGMIVIGIIGMLLDLIMRKIQDKQPN